MLFSNQKKNDPQTEKKSGSWMNFMFNPEFGNDIRPMGESIRMFVELIALLFAANGLFPKNHPSLLRTEGAPRLTLSMVLNIARSQLDFTSREGLPKIILYYAVSGMLFFSTITVILVLLSLFLGTAHAAEAASACTGTGIFDPCTDKDLSIQWIDYLFQGKQILDSSTGEAIPQSDVIPKILTKTLGFYSGAVLVLAGVILLYHLLSIIVNTAHSGKVMGNANQVWAPIRLVVAIGLLVPIAGGLNVGQSIVIQMAKWGCGLASQTWNKFLTTMTDEAPMTISVIPPYIEATIHDILIMNACKKAYASESLLFGDIIPKFSFSKNDGKSGEYGEVCGSYTMPPYDYSGTTFSELAKNAYDTNQALLNKIVNDPQVATLGSKVNYYLTKNKDGLKEPTYKEYYDIIQIHQKNINSEYEKISAKTQSPIKQHITKVNEAWTRDGWVSAGAWFNTMSRAQGIIFNIGQDYMPITTLPSYSFWSNLGNRVVEGASVGTLGGGYGVAAGAAVGALVGLGRAGAMERAVDATNAFANAVTNPSPTDSDAASIAALGADYPISTSHGKDNIMSFLSALDAIAQRFGLWPNATTKQVIFPLKTANPLMELVGLGHRQLANGLGIISVGLSTSVTSALGSSASDLIGTIGGAILSRTGGTKAALKGGSMVAASILGKLGFGALASVSGLIIMVGGMFAISGFLLAFMLPLLPFFRFFFSIMSWAIMVFEAIVAMPLFALGHLNPAGEGLPGGAKTGYNYIFAILLRPVLMIFGLIAGILLFFIAVTFLNKMFLIATAGAGSGTGGLATLSKLIFSFIYCILAYICANTCFKCIGHFPSHNLAWMGISGPAVKDIADVSELHGKTMAMASLMIGAQGLSKVSDAAAGVAGRIGSAAGDATKIYKDYRDKNIIPDQKKNMVKEKAGEFLNKNNNQRFQDILSMTPGANRNQELAAYFDEQFAKDPDAKKYLKDNDLDRDSFKQQFMDQSFAMGKNPPPNNQGAQNPPPNNSGRTS